MNDIIGKIKNAYNNYAQNQNWGSRNTVETNERNSYKGDPNQANLLVMPGISGTAIGGTKEDHILVPVNPDGNRVSKFSVIDSADDLNDINRVILVNVGTGSLTLKNTTVMNVLSGGTDQLVECFNASGTKVASIKIRSDKKYEVHQINLAGNAQYVASLYDGNVTQLAQNNTQQKITPPQQEAVEKPVEENVEQEVVAQENTQTEEQEVVAQENTQTEEQEVIAKVEPNEKQKTEQLQKTKETKQETQENLVKTETTEKQKTKTEQEAIVKVETTGDKEPIAKVETTQENKQETIAKTESSESTNSEQTKTIAKVEKQKPVEIVKETTTQNSTENTQDSSSFIDQDYQKMYEDMMADIEKQKQDVRKETLAIEKKSSNKNFVDYDNPPLRKNLKNKKDVDISKFKAEVVKHEEHPTEKIVAKQDNPAALDVPIEFAKLSNDLENIRLKRLELVARMEAEKKKAEESKSTTVKIYEKASSLWGSFTKSWSSKTEEKKAKKLEQKIIEKPVQFAQGGLRLRPSQLAKYQKQVLSGEQAPVKTCTIYCKKDREDVINISSKVPGNYIIRNSQPDEFDIVNILGINNQTEQRLRIFDDGLNSYTISINQNTNVKFAKGSIPNLKLTDKQLRIVEGGKDKTYEGDDNNEVFIFTNSKPVNGLVLNGKGGTNEYIIPTNQEIIGKGLKLVASTNDHITVQVDKNQLNAFNWKNYLKLTENNTVKLFLQGANKLTETNKPITFDLMSAPKISFVKPNGDSLANLTVQNHRFTMAH